MVQIFENKKQSVGERLSQGLQRGLDMGSQLVQEKAKKEKEQETYKQLGLDPAIANLPEKFQQEFVKKSIQDAENKRMEPILNDFADKLESKDPNMKPIADIYRMPGISLDDKSKIVKDITGKDIYKDQQQKRMQFDSIQKRYTNKIKELTAELKDMPLKASTNKEKFERLTAQKEMLTKERDGMLQFGLSSGTIDFDDLMNLNNEEDLESTPEKSNKVKFNPNNPEHVAKRTQLEKKYNGDKQKVNADLAKEFTK